MIVPVPDGSRRTVNVQTDDPEYAARRAAEWAAENPIVERGAELGEEDVSALGDIGRAVGAGIVGAAEGIATLPADLGMSDEQSREELEKFFNRYKPEVKTELGKAVKFITQFVVPGGAAAKLAKGLGPLGKIGAFAAADVAATTPDAIPTAHSSRLSIQMLDRLEKKFMIYQLDITAYPGNSGSPLYSADSGEVVGILNKVFVKESKETVLEKPSGISYAIPVKYLTQLALEQGIEVK